jgi:hypothetical protein
MGWPGAADGLGQSPDGRMVEPERGHDLEAALRTRDDDRGRLDVALLGDRVDQDLEARPETIDVGKRAGAGNQDLARGDVGHVPSRSTAIAAIVGQREAAAAVVSTTADPARGLPVSRLES